MIMKITHDWMDDISLACQGVLMLAQRGPDGSKKETLGKQMTRAIRAACLRGAHFKGHDDFMGNHSGMVDLEMAEYFINDHDEYPHHWLMHLIHAGHIIAVYHDDHEVRRFWRWFYMEMVKVFHMSAEADEDMIYRLRDRHSIQQADPEIQEKLRKV